MSWSVIWGEVPSEPKRLGGTSHPFKGWVLQAVSLGSFNEVEPFELRNSPVILEKGSHAHTYLKGVLAGMGHSDQDYDTLNELLNDIERLGQVLISAEN